MNKAELDKYYARYLTFHTKKGTRILHCIGNVATVLYIVYCLYNCLWALVLAPFIIYLFAWPSHWWIEGNRPAAFKNPILAKISDWRMMFDMIRGKLK